MSAPNVGFQGQDRRTGMERRQEAPRELKNRPRLITSIQVAGEGVFGPGQEFQFVQAAERANARAKEAKQEPAVDMEALQARGAIENLVGVKAPDQGARKASTSEGSTRGAQLARTGDTYEDTEVKGGRMGPETAAGGRPQDELNPLPPELPEGTAARTGGAGRTGEPAGRGARGERSGK